MEISNSFETKSLPLQSVLARLLGLGIADSTFAIPATHIPLTNQKFHLGMNPLCQKLFDLVVIRTIS